MKSNENHCIYIVFERLGHWKTDGFPFKIHQGTWLQFHINKEHTILKQSAQLLVVSIKFVLVEFTDVVLENVMVA